MLFSSSSSSTGRSKNIPIVIELSLEPVNKTVWDLAADSLRIYRSVAIEPVNSVRDHVLGYLPARRENNELSFVESSVRRKCSASRIASGEIHKRYEIRAIA